MAYPLFRGKIFWWQCRVIVSGSNRHMMVTKPRQQWSTSLQIWTILLRLLAKRLNVYLDGGWMIFQTELYRPFSSHMDPAILRHSVGQLYPTWYVFGDKAGIPNNSSYIQQSVYREDSMKAMTRIIQFIDTVRLGVFFDIFILFENIDSHMRGHIFQEFPMLWCLIFAKGSIRRF